MSDLIDRLTQIILRDFPDAQAVYLYGSYAHSEQRPDSDIDLAVLLPHSRARAVGSLTMSQTQLDLGYAAHRDVDLVNLRIAPSVLQNQIVNTGQCVFLVDEFAIREFEMMSLSYYMKLNEERAEIVKAFRESKRAYNV